LFYDPIEDTFQLAREDNAKHDNGDKQCHEKMWIERPYVARDPFEDENDKEEQNTHAKNKENGETGTSSPHHHICSGRLFLGNGLRGPTHGWLLGFRPCSVYTRDGAERKSFAHIHRYEIQLQTPGSVEPDPH
jgi:hypothetical protein